MQCSLNALKTIFGPNKCTIPSLCLCLPLALYIHKTQSSAGNEWRTGKFLFHNVKVRLLVKRNLWLNYTLTLLLTKCYQKKVSMFKCFFGLHGVEREETSSKTASHFTKRNNSHFKKKIYRICTTFCLLPKIVSRLLLFLLKIFLKFSLYNNITKANRLLVQDTHK